MLALRPRVELHRDSEESPIQTAPSHAETGDMTRRSAAATRRAASARPMTTGEAPSEASLRRALAERAPDGPADEALAGTCFAQGLADLGARFALRSLAAFRAHGDVQGAERALASAEAHAAQLAPRSLESLACARAEAGQLGAAARLLHAAAERWRGSGRAERAAAACLRAARWQPGAPGLSRCWALALAAAGDLDGALGHAARWSAELGGASRAVESELAAACGAGAAAELVARARRLTAAAAAPTGAEPASRRAFLSPGLSSHRRTLLRALARAGIAVIEGESPADIVEEASRAGALELLILPIGADLERARRCVHALRARSGLATLPILGVPEGGVDPDALGELRRLGLAGVLDAEASSETVLARVEQILERSSRERRVHARISVDLELIVELNGRESRERADQLSCGGLRLRSSGALEPNAELGLRFRLSANAEPAIETRARVIYCQAPTHEREPYAAGIFFLGMTPSDRSRVEEFVARRICALP
jgi:hypothetical protein